MRPDEDDRSALVVRPVFVIGVVASPRHVRRDAVLLHKNVMQAPDAADFHDFLELLGRDPRLRRVLMTSGEGAGRPDAEDECLRIFDMLPVEGLHQRAVGAGVLLRHGAGLRVPDDLNRSLGIVPVLVFRPVGTDAVRIDPFLSQNQGQTVAVGSQGGFFFGREARRVSSDESGQDQRLPDMAGDHGLPLLVQERRGFRLSGLVPESGLQNGLAFRIGLHDRSGGRIPDDPGQSARIVPVFVCHQIRADAVRADAPFGQEERRIGGFRGQLCFLRIAEARSVFAAQSQLDHLPADVSGEGCCLDIVDGDGIVGMIEMNVECDDRAGQGNGQHENDT